MWSRFKCLKLEGWIYVPCCESKSKRSFWNVENQSMQSCRKSCIYSFIKVIFCMGISKHIDIWMYSRWSLRVKIKVKSQLYRFSYDFIPMISTGRSSNQWLSPPGCAMFSLQVHFPIDSYLGRHPSILQHVATTALVSSLADLSPQHSQVRLICLHNYFQCN